jgi:asparagine synthase (glutamine-hydrolysing)
VPPPLRQRPKRGFGVPLASWFRGGWGPRLQEVLLDPAARSAAWFDPGTIERLFHDHTARRADHGALLWALLMFELWAQEQPA